MYSHESCSQVFVWLLRTCSDRKRYKYLAYDRACELHPYIKKLARKGNECAQEVLANCDFMVDLFHVKTHVRDECCLKSEKCRYHPQLDRFKEVHSVNHECCEQSFSYLSKFKFTTKRMTRYRFQVFVYHVIDKRNAKIESNLRKKGLMT